MHFNDNELLPFEILDNALMNLQTATNLKDWDLVKLATSQVENAFNKIMEDDN